MNTRQAKISMSAMAVALLFTSASAVAQSTAPTNEPTAGEIVVTANKREQKLNDVGLTVAVLSGQNLRNQQINSLADVANATPSLSFANTATGTPVYTLRGVGFYEQSIGSYPAVSVYIDEVPLPFPVLTAHSTFDLDRLEIIAAIAGHSTIKSTRAKMGPTRAPARPPARPPVPKTSTSSSQSPPSLKESGQRIGASIKNRALRRGKKEEKEKGLAS